MCIVSTLLLAWHLRLIRESSLLHFEFIKAGPGVVRPGEHRVSALADDDIGGGEDLAVPDQVPRHRAAVRAAQRDVQVARRPGQGPHQRGDLEMLGERRNLKMWMRSL